MTTIAYKNGTLATDSRVINNGWIGHDLAEKVVVVQDQQFGPPVYFAIAGDLVEGRAAIQAILKRERYATQDNNTGFTIMGVNADKEIRVWCHGETHTDGETIPKPFWAIGSGRIAAMAAMEAGSDAVGAVTIAGKIDPNTGGETRIYQIIDLLEK
ncbi:MAG: hypothetical protein ACK53X_03235 [Holosporales bacterium]|jgi:hypothetical protein